MNFTVEVRAYSHYFTSLLVTDIKLLILLFCMLCYCIQFILLCYCDLLKVHLM